MPSAHRNTDSRACGALTTVVGQTTVYVNNLLWAVEFDLDTHCLPKGPLKPKKREIYIENKNIIVIGDEFHAIDYEPPLCIIPHTPTPTGGSPDTYAY